MIGYFLPPPARFASGLPSGKPTRELTLKNGRRGKLRLINNSNTGMLIGVRDRQRSTNFNSLIGSPGHFLFGLIDLLILFFGLPLLTRRLQPHFNLP